MSSDGTGLDPDGESPIRHRFVTSAQASAADLRRADCAACGARWVVHKALVDSRVSCTCGVMFEVPPTAADRAAQAPPPPLPRSKLLTLEERYAQSPRKVARVGRDGALPVIYSIDDRQERGMLHHATPQVQASWTNRLLLELLAVLAALMLPPMLIEYVVSGGARIALAPLASVLSGVLVLAIGFTVPTYAFGACRRFAGRFVAEALLAVLLFLAFAMAWMELMDYLVPEAGPDLITDMLSKHHLATILFMVAVVPGVFEEIAFRGILQSRLSALYGRNMGILYTGIAFGLAHFVTPALAVHLALGFYLCWLRSRSASLWPCIIFHVCYNAGVVLLVYAQSAPD